LGFNLVGITSAKPHPDRLCFFEWLDQGMAATMDWMYRSREKRGEPTLVLPGVQSIICVGLLYKTDYPQSLECQDKERGWISNYAWGDDYHEVFLSKLKLLEQFIHEKNLDVQTKSYVDTGPLLERSYAASSGLGWIGKNTCLIHPHLGSFFFLGEILTNLKLEFDASMMDHCGKCTRCIDACPTQALTPHKLDANKCISYLTIEHRGRIDEKLVAQVGHHIVGCDICQDVCPWNDKAPCTKEKSFEPGPGLFNPDLDSLEKIGENFSEIFKKSPIKRLKKEGWERNLKIVRKNKVV